MPCPRGEVFPGPVQRRAAGDPVGDQGPHPVSGAGGRRQGVGGGTGRTASELLPNARLIPSLLNRSHNRSQMNVFYIDIPRCSELRIKFVGAP